MSVIKYTSRARRHPQQPISTASQGKVYPLLFLCTDTALCPEYELALLPAHTCTRTDIHKETRRGTQFPGKQQDMNGNRILPDTLASSPRPPDVGYIGGTQTSDRNTQRSAI